jgi:hypothetical protein
MTKLPNPVSTQQQPPPAAPVVGTVLLDDLAAFFERFCVFRSPAQRDAIVLWVAHTYAIDAFEVTPRLAVLSPEKQCGKSRLLELIELTAADAHLTVNMSAAYLFRKIDEGGGTFLFDEVDTIFSSRRSGDASEDLRGLINAGHRRGAMVGRVVTENKTLVPKDFLVFAPVALAGIGNCLPETVLDRSVLIRMRRRAPHEQVGQFRRKVVEIEANKLQGRLITWAQQNLDRLTDAAPKMPPGIEDRAADTWEALLAIADLVGGEWPTRARAACVELNAAREEADPSHRVLLLDDIRALFKTKGRARMFSDDLAGELNRLHDRPWSGWNSDQGIKQRDLARILVEFDIKPKTLRTGGLQKKGYELSQFTEAFERYVPSMRHAGTDEVPSHNDSPVPSQGVDLDRDGGTDGTARSKGSTVRPLSLNPRFDADEDDDWLGLDREDLR